MLKTTDNLNTSYLHFDAFSIRDAIKTYISNDSKFTDQDYEGSNLSIIIDLVALMYQCLIYNLNNTASESMFSDSEIYENINRIVKLIGYSPKGYSTSVLNAVVHNDNKTSLQLTTLPKYAAVDTGVKDTKGNIIYYSTISDTSIEDGTSFNITLYNGIWKLYNIVNTAKQSPYETFILNLTTTPSTNTYIAYPHIHVYVKSDTVLTQWKRVDNIHEYSSTDTVFELRLNEDGRYSIKCGDGTHGALFPKNSEIYVFYLQSNGPEGIISGNGLNDLKFKLNTSLLGISTDLFTNLYRYVTSDIQQFNAYITSFKIISNSTASSPKLEESAAEIKINAPKTLNLGNRLVTAKDVENWLKLNYTSEIHDVKTVNNWEYITTFYAWLYNIGTSVYKNGQKYINSSILSKYDLNYTSAADANSIYAWIKTLGSSHISTDRILRELADIKLLTANIILLPTLTYNFAICAAPSEYAKKHYFTTDGFDPTNENYIEVTVDDFLTYSPALIKTSVKNTILSFFNDTNFYLGQTVDISKLNNEILSIPGITALRTCFVPRDSERMSYNPQRINGLVFATWTSEVINSGDDLLISSLNRSPEIFQFPSLLSTALDDKIKIITTNSNISKVN